MNPNGRGLLERMRDAVRSFRIDGINLKDPALARLLGGEPAAAGIAISEQNALNLSPVWDAVNTITSTITSLPIHLFHRLPNGGREPFRSHPLYELLHSTPNPEMSAGQFLTCVMVNTLLTGNGYAEIERDAAHRPVGLWPIPPFRVVPERDEAGRLFYRVRLDSGRDVMIPAEDMLHVSGLSRDGVVGLSPIACARESLGLAAAAERFGATFFGNGSTFGGFLSHPARLSPEARQNIEASLTKHQGPTHAHRLLLLQENMTFIERRGIPPEDAQFLATRVFQIQEVARWFNLPAHKLGDLSHATYSNIEHMSIEYSPRFDRPVAASAEAGVQSQIDLAPGADAAVLRVQRRRRPAW